MNREVSQRHEAVDAVHRVLACRRRRRAIRILDEQGGTATVGVLVERLADPDGSRAGRPDRDRIELELHHVHIPLMVESDTVEYDADARRIELTGHGRTVAEVGRFVDGCFVERRADHA